MNGEPTVRGSLAPHVRTDAHSPRLFDASREECHAELSELLSSGLVAEVFDSLRAQATELVETRHADQKLTPAELAEATTLIVGHEPERYGTWVYYPWSGRLVHVLPEREFEEVRTSRNRNKISREEQTRLGLLRLGIAGLSVGQATAVTLALEGIGAEFRLADFDTISLSNLNRLRAGVHEIGTNKAVSTARAIFEINPYVRIEVFCGGITEENLSTFLGSPTRLDVLFEECDDFAIKVRLREGARALGIPVLMETSDRGMLDVERFDLEPQRPLFHGLAGELNARQLHGLSTYEKIPLVLSILGQVSPRAAASLVDIDSTLKTWPQLASAVSLGAALNTDAARRVALGQFTRSGRFYADFDNLLSDSEVKEPLAELAPDAPIESAANAPPDVLIPAWLEKIVRWAALAPSGGNCQPWRFVYRSAENILEFWHVPERSVSFLDFEHSGAHLALGAAIENARLAIVELGLSATFEVSPSGDERWVARVHFGHGPTPRTPVDAELAAAVELRVTNRKIGARSELPDHLIHELAAIATQAGANLEVLSLPESIAEVGAVVARGEKFRILHPGLHREMMSEVRFSREEALRTCDGLDLATLELSPGDAAGLKLLRSSNVIAALREVGGGEGLKRSVHKAFAAASAVGLLRVAGHGKRAYLAGGQAIQRVWLLAAARGVAFQPMTALLYLLARLEGGAPGLDGDERRQLAALRLDLSAQFSAFSGSEIMLFRLAVSGPPSARSLRRDISKILEVI